MQPDSSFQILNAQMIRRYRRRQFKRKRSLFKKGMQRTKKEILNHRLVSSLKPHPCKLSTNFHKLLNLATNTLANEQWTARELEGHYCNLATISDRLANA
ncbi:hypothetical protein ElyMa_003813300 [Elysia marginata]|uniref:Uncharacterized protein n=1 Tax=Elysia marginata TaxID=1093978 RepID=A0AAV4FEM8_9GAST|nr:hypothetical protein ElyMa_003813300 [Elysia marginata]